MIPYGRQDITEDDIAAVVSVLRSNWLTQGPAIERFERAVAEYTGAAHAVAVCNATAALHLACRALGLGAGDTLWTVPNTFVASANCARYCGANVDFVDIDPLTYNMSVDALQAKLIQAEKLGQLPKIVVPVHFAGQPCDMISIRGLADSYGFSIIEDASHAIGARYRQEPVGKGSYSDMTIFSFHPVKIITTGEGGMVLTNKEPLADKVRLLRSHGITRNAQCMEGESEGPWYYQQVELGYNYRITDIQAALGASQLQRLDTFCTRRRALAERYNFLLADAPAQLPWQQPDAESAWHLYVVQVDRRRQVFEKLREAGIGANVHYIPVHLQPDYRRLGFKSGDFPISESYYSKAISLPMFSALTDHDQSKVVDELKKALI